MNKPKFLHEASQDDVLICPHCGTVFDKMVRGESSSFWDGKGYFCPGCNEIAESIPEEDEKEKENRKPWFDEDQNLRAKVKR